MWPDELFSQMRNLAILPHPLPCTEINSTGLLGFGRLLHSSVQSFSRVWLFVTPWTTARQASLSITNSRSLLKLMSIESVMPSSHLILSRPLLLLPSVFPSIRVFSNASALHIRWSKYWSLSFSISPSSEYGMYIGRGILWEKSCVGQLWRLYFERNLGWEIW